LHSVEPAISKLPTIPTIGNETQSYKDQLTPIDADVGLRHSYSGGNPVSGAEVQVNSTLLIASVILLIVIFFVNRFRTNPIAYNLDCAEIGNAVLQVWDPYNDHYDLDVVGGPGNGWTCDGVG
jgi:hypothetical protein